jgi:phage baseplate assembly protein W
VATDRVELFGHDLALIGALSSDLTATASGDLRTTTGTENIAQALGMRLRVRAGELARLGFPDYGSRLHELIGEPNTQRTRLLLLAHARTAVEQDPRVVEVTAATATVLPGERDTVRLALDVALITEPEPLNLVFDVRLGGAGT